MKKNFNTYFCLITGVLFLSIILSGNRHTIFNKKAPNSNIQKYNLNNNDIIYDKVININDSSDVKIKVYITEKKTIQEIPIENYVVGVVCGEMPAEFSSEALKAQAVAARTYGAAHMKQFNGNPYKDGNGWDVTDTISCQVYMDKETRMAGWPSSTAEKLWNKVCKAVNDTKGEVITYDGKIIEDPYYFAVSSGKTENAEDIFASNVPYLKSVKSTGDNASSKFNSKVILKNKDIIYKINSQYSNSIDTKKKLNDQIKIISRTDAGSVKSIKVGKTTITGPTFRALFSLNSSNFNIKFNSDKVEISCSGYGHDVGMSQWGANGMAKDGKNYTEILKHYYTGVNIEKMIK